MAKEKKILIICAILIISLIIIPNCIRKKVEDEKSENNLYQINNVNISDVHDFSELDYDNPSEIEKEYINNKYLGAVLFTNRGTEVYRESVSSGRLWKIITNSWPEEEEIARIIPATNFGKLNRIEYAEEWISVYIENVKKSDFKKYVKELEDYGYTENKQKTDNRNILEYELYNKSGDCVNASLRGQTNFVIIQAEKSKNS